MRAFLLKMTTGKFLLYTPDGDKSSVGAFWDNTKQEASPPLQDKSYKMKYDHILNNFCLQNAEYDWNFLKCYNSEQFRSDGKEIVAGVPDHAILRAEIKICK